MKNKQDICVIIQARLESERVPKKMVRPFAGTTLVDILLDKLSSSQVIPATNIYFSVYEKELKTIGRKHGINIFNRSKESSLSEGQPLATLYDWYDKLPYEYVVLLNACNPLLSIKTIDKFIQKYSQSSNEGMFAVFEKKTYYWDANSKPLTDWGDSTIMNTKFVAPIYEAANCLFASRMDIIGNDRWMDTKVPAEPELFVMDELEAFDIDYEWQFKVAELLYVKSN